ncbi:MAG: ATP-binding protein [Hyphomicrobiales bacterium]
MRAFSSLQVRLLIAFVSVAAIALGVAAGAFLAIRAGDERDDARLRIDASYMAIAGAFSLRQIAGASPDELQAVVDELADKYDVRVLMLDANDTIVHDSASKLDGSTFEPGDDMRYRDAAPASAIRFEPATSTGTEFIVVRGDPSVFTGAADASPPVTTQQIVPSAQGVTVDLSPPKYQVALAIPPSLLSRAWSSTLPGLAIAAGIALPLAAAVALFAARHITRPLVTLTTASHEFATGRLETPLPVERSDEVGRLSRAFAEMTARVTAAQAEMRTLIQNVSHDMKTPLTSIMGFAQALKDGRPGDMDQAVRMGAIIHDEAQNLSARLTGLIYLSELEAGAVIVEPRPFDAGALLRELANRIGAGATARGLEFEADIPGEPLMANADPAKVERALENLLDNARRFAPEGGRIRVAAARDATAVCLDVTNDAPDLTEADVPRLFERFYRLDRTRASHGAPGTGLGLPIARDLATLNKGTLTATLSGGEITFTLSLPATG